MTGAPPANPRRSIGSPEQKRLVQSGLSATELGAWAIIGIEGRLDPERLGHALDVVVRRHEILRTEIEANGDSVHQIVRPVARVDLARLERPGWTPPGGGLAEDPWLDGSRGGAPIRAALVESGPDEAFLFLEGSRFSLDGPSYDHLLVDIVGAYAGSAGLGPAEELLQYGDVAEWENELLSGEEGESGRSFWKAVRWPEEPVRMLPFQRARQPGSRIATMDRLVTELDAGTAGGLFALCGARAAPPEVAILALYHVLLWRYAGRSEPVVSARSDGRGYEALADAVGPYARDLPIYVALSAELGFERFLDLTRTRWDEAREWEQVLDASLVRGGKEPVALEPTFGFSFFNPPPEEVADGARFRLIDRGVEGSRRSLDLRVCHSPVRTRLIWSFNGEETDRAYVEALSRSLASLARDAAESPSTPIGRLGLLDAHEYARLVEKPNDTRRPYPEDRLIHDFIEERAREHPDGIAVEAGGRSLTYGELDRRANGLAHTLTQRGVGPGVLVTILAERSFGMIVGALGVLKAGGGYVPLSPSYPPERLSFIMDQVKAPLLLVVGEPDVELPEGGPEVIYVGREAADLAPGFDEGPHRSASPDDVAYVIYTSGSTGEPKGVVVTHRTFVISNEARIEYYGRDVERFLLLSPFAFDSSIVGIFWTLTVGGALSLIDEHQQRDIEGLCATIAERGISHLLTLPSFYDMILTHGDPSRLAGLQTVIVAGEACPLAMVQRHREALPGTGLFSEYGATETTIWSSAYDCLNQTTPTAPLGRPIGNCEMYVLDPDLQPLPVGVPGEVHFGGAILAQGYWGRPDLTEERFIRSPFSTDPGARLYKSGDLARFLPNGDMEFLGRIDNQVKIRGFRVELEEIEIALMAHPDLAEAAVAAREASEWDRGDAEASPPGSGGKRLVGYVVAKSGTALPTASGLRDFLLERVPSYMVPVAFVPMDSLPKNPNGKLDREALPPVGDSALESVAAEGAAPQSPTEQTLAEIWKRVLGIDEVGRDDNFFELGGDSILSIQVVALANKTGLGLSARDVFEQQTIATLARRSSSAPPIDATQGLVTGPIPLHPIQHWFFEQDRPNPDHANMTILLRVDERLEAESLQEAVRSLQRHHDALRARFTRDDEGWRADIGASAFEGALDIIDVADVSEDQWHATIEAESRAAQTSLDIAAGDLLRVVYFDAGADTAGRLLVVAHHLVFDGVSLRIFLEDLREAYLACAAGTSVPIPPKTTSYGRWNEALVERAGSTDLQAQMGFWTGVLPTHAEVELPRDGAGSVTNTFADQQVVTSQLSEEVTSRLLTESPNVHDARIDELLLSALALTISSWTGHSGVYLDLEGHGREPHHDTLDVSRTVGWFTTVFPAYLPVASDSSMADAVVVVRDTLRSTPEKGAGFGILRYLADESIRREMAALPRAQLNFNYLGQFGQVMEDAGLFQPARESAGPDFDESADRPHVLEVVASVLGGRMRIDWMFGGGIHDPATVSALADDYAARLQDLVEAGPATRDGVTAGLDEFAFDEADIEDIAAAVQRARAEK